MPRERHRWSPICDPPKRLVRPLPIDPNGSHGPTPGQASGPRYRRTSKGMHVPSDVDAAVPEQRILEQSVLLPSAGAVTGWAALRLRQASFFDGLQADGITEKAVPLISGPGQSRRPRPGVRWLEDRLDATEGSLVYGIPCTRAERALFDEMRRADDLREAVVAVDMAAAAQLISIARMDRYLRDRTGWLGVPQVRAALELADEDSRSPNETRLRLRWQLDAGMPRPLVNQPVWSLSGRLLGIADLLDPVAGVVGEFDGADHRGPSSTVRTSAGRDGSATTDWRCSESPGRTYRRKGWSWSGSPRPTAEPSGCLRAGEAGPSLLRREPNRS